MVVSVKQFKKQLIESGLMSAQEVDAVITELETPAQTAEELAKALIQAGKLTKFQAKLIAAGKGKSLTLDRYTIQDKIGAGGMGQVYLAGWPSHFHNGWVA